MNKVRSNDGTIIAYEQVGKGSPVILVDGALSYQGAGLNVALAAVLAPYFTAFTYDRRGRGESSDTKPYAIEREIEDLEALIKAAGGSAFVYGISSGAALALEAANRGLPIKKLALYEAPFIVDNSRDPIPANYTQQMDALIAANKRGDAVRLFMKVVEVPAIFIAMMRFMPVWSKLKGVAHTLPYDTAFVIDYQQGKPLPANGWASATMPTLVVGGGKSPMWMQNGVKALADVLPHATHRTLAGQTHIVKPEALAPVLIEFFQA